MVGCCIRVLYVTYRFSGVPVIQLSKIRFMVARDRFYSILITNSSNQIKKVKSVREKRIMHTERSLKICCIPRLPFWGSTTYLLLYTGWSKEKFTIKSAAWTNSQIGFFVIFFFYAYNTKRLVTNLGFILDRSI